MKQLFPHQLDASNFAFHRKSAGFFMRMRCGKTLACLHAIYRLEGFPAIIIAPASVLASWEDEIIGMGVNRADIVIVRAKANTSPERLRQRLLMPGKFFLINFEMVRRLNPFGIRSNILPVLGVREWKTIVIDESYRISNFEGRVWEYLSRFPPLDNQHRFILSGAPASESPLNFATQYLFMDGVYFGCKTVAEYLDKYWFWNEYTYKWVMKDKNHGEAILKYVHNTAYCTTLEDLGLGGKRLYRLHRVELNQAQHDALLWLQTITTYTNKQGKTVLVNPLIKCLFEALISCGFHPLTGELLSRNKMDAAVQIWADHPEPTLTISRFTAPIEPLAAAYSEAGARVATFTGDTKPEARQAIRKAFQAGELDIVVAQVIPVKMGLDFSRLNRIVYISNSFSHDDRAQSEERGQHTLRKEPYEIIDIVSDGTHDNVVTNVLTVKKENAILYCQHWCNEIGKI